MSILRFLTLVLFVNIELVRSQTTFVVEPVELAEALYAEWAHHHWVWIGNNQETQANLIDHVTDYLSYSIPVGAVNVDSAWPSNYQNFKWNPKKFPDSAQMVAHFHSLNIKVICWITSTINNDSSNYQEAKQNGYMLNEGKLITWWRGHAGLLDYTNPKALDWWHQQMDQVLDIGIDGWKCDGTDPYVWELLDARGYKGHVTEREYADLYYRDFFYYTRKKRGPEALIMARPTDNFKEILFVNYAPNDVMFSGWVGDQTGDWDGIKVALDNIIHSAWRGYLNFGCDIGGYRTDGKTPLGREKNVFIRWFQLGAFLPLMENGGEGEHRPWMFGEDVTPIYRLFANIHTELATYLLTAGTESYAKKVSVIRPMARRIPFGRPNVFDYMLYTDLFVSPFVDNSTQKNITFPGNSTVKWVYWFNSTTQFKGGDEVANFTCPYTEFPVFIRAGSIIPLRVENSYSKMGTSYSKGFLTILLTKPANGSHVKNVHEFQSKGYRITYDYNQAKNVLDIYVTAHATNRFIFLLNEINASPMVVEVRSSAMDMSVQKVAELNDGDSFWRGNVNAVYKPTLNKAFIKITDDAKAGLHVILKNIN